MVFGWSGRCVVAFAMRGGRRCNLMCLRSWLGGAMNDWHGAVTTAETGGRRSSRRRQAQLGRCTGCGMTDAGGKSGSHRAALVHVALDPLEHRVALFPVALLSVAHEGRHGRARGVRASACRAEEVRAMSVGHRQPSASDVPSLRPVPSPHRHPPRTASQSASHGQCWALRLFCAAVYSAILALILRPAADHRQAAALPP
jgi:hypothetical protein